MGTYATAADVAALHTLYLALIDDMEYASSAPVLAIWKQEAENALDLWADAKLAEQNINASAASNYSSGIGMSVQKKAATDQAAAAQAHFDLFVQTLLKGGVIVPSTDESMGVWDLRGYGAEVTR